jgi:hypothetical protein
VKAAARQAIPRPGEARRLRGELADRLAGRREELQAAVHARIRAVADPGEIADPAYTEGLSAAIGIALEYAIEAIEANRERPAPVPVALLAQARLAARNRVGIDVVLRRYLAGYTLVGDFLVAEAADLGLAGEPLKRLLGAHAAVLDRLLVAVSEEHSREARFSPAPADHRLRLVHRLLAGEQADADGLRYELEGSHVGLVAAGPGAAKAVHDIAVGASCRVLTVCSDSGSVWAWLGRSRPLKPGELSQLAGTGLPAGTVLGLGESADGLDGWRLSHRQAAAALPVARRKTNGIARYIDVALLVSVLRDDLLASSLRNFYLAPLAQSRDGGAAARETLRAYFAADRNVSSAAAVLGVNRTTATSRLRAVEAAVGRPISACAAELEIALRLAEADP